MRNWLIAACLCLAAASSAGAQPRGQRGGGEDPAIAPAELQRMFDAYALMQAQEQLKISEQSYAPFLTRFKALQDTRRKALVERTRRIVELRRLGNDPRSDEGAIRERLRELDDFEERAAGEIRQAYASVAQVLDVRQQAQFRAFEELMERRKLELISRARQAARPRKQL